MTTTLNKALKESGLAIATNKRIWNWLKERGEHTGAEIAAGLKIPLSASSSVISTMVNRKMLTVEKKFSKYAGRPIGYYSTCGREFMILPLTPKASAPAVSEIVVAPPLATKIVEQIVSVTPAATQSIDDILNSLSIVQAQKLYQQLDAIFNAPKRV